MANFEIIIVSNIDRTALRFTNTTNGGSAVNSSVTNAYLGRDGALIQSVTHDSNTGSGSNPIWTTNYSYNRRNDLLLADINDGRPRDVTYVTDLNGQIIRRDEADTVGANGDPHERTCRFAGKQIEVYWLSRFPPKTAWGRRQRLIRRLHLRRLDRRPPGCARATFSRVGAFRNGATGGGSHADFDQGVAVINSYGQGSGAGALTVRGGETLSSIAGDLWGDRSAAAAAFSA